MLSEIGVDIFRPFDFLGPEETEESRGYFMFAKMLTSMWEPFLPSACYSGDGNSEFESDDDDYDDDGHDEDDKYGTERHSNRSE